MKIFRSCRRQNLKKTWKIEIEVWCAEPKPRLHSSRIAINRNNHKNLRGPSQCVPFICTPNESVYLLISRVIRKCSEPLFRFGVTALLIDKQTSHDRHRWLGHNFSRQIISVGTINECNINGRGGAFFNSILGSVRLDFNFSEHTVRGRCYFPSKCHSIVILIMYRFSDGVRSLFVSVILHSSGNDPFKYTIFVGHQFKIYSRNFTQSSQNKSCDRFTCGSKRSFYWDLHKIGSISESESEQMVCTKWLDSIKTQQTEWGE